MGVETTRVDAYIRRADMCVQPTLIFIRRVVHAVCPGVEETMRRGVPHFVYHGDLCSMAASGEHIRFGFSRGSKVVETRREKAATARFARLRKIGDLPPKPELERLVRKAMKVNEAEPRRSRTSER